MDISTRYFPRHPTVVRTAVWMALVAICYFAAARLGLSMAIKPQEIAPVWLPSGIFLSALLLTRPGLRLPLALVIILTDLVTELLAGIPAAVSVIYALTLGAEGMLSTLLLVRIIGEPLAFRRTRDVIGLFGLASILSSGTMALVAAAASHFILGASFWDSWKWWAAADAMGTLLVVPLNMSYVIPGFRGVRLSPRRVLEGMVLFSSLVVLNILAFGYLTASGMLPILLTYLAFPFLLWAAIRFGVQGASLALACLAAIVLAFATSGHALGVAFFGVPLNDLIAVQLYLAILAFPSLLLGAAITEREDTVQTLRRGEALLNKAEQIAEVGSWEHDHATGHLAWTDEVYRIFGVSPRAFTATYAAFLEAVHPDDRAAVDDAYTGSLKEGRDSYEIVHRIVRQPSGEIRWVHEKCEHVRGASGRVERSMGMVHDITQRRRAEDALRERNRYIETILERSPIGFAVNTISDSRALFVGGRFEDIYGLPRGSVRSVEEFFKTVYREPAFRERMIARITADVASGDASRMHWDDIPITTVAGEQRFISATNIPVPDQDLMVSTVQDVTARHRAEQALRESEERFRSLVEQAGDGFELAGADGRIVDVNGATCRQLGYTREELLRLSISDIDPVVSRELYSERFSALVGRPPLTFETVHRRKDGTTFPVEINTAIIRLGDSLRALTLVRDISERRRAQDEGEKLRAQLVQAQKMESVGRLAGGVAHDFNNMLGVILGHAELALAVLPADSPQREGLQEIQLAARRSADLTRQLLAFARKQTIAPRLLDLNAAVAGTLKMIRRLIGEDIDLSWRPLHGPLAVRMDPAQIDQILANLCLNARDAIAGVGKVTIETLSVTFDTAYCATHPGALPGRYAMLVVSDDGMGMAPEVLDHVFEPFFTTKDSSRGTGLGLATVYGVVKQNDGFINVYSEPGQGTTFRIYLPQPATDAVEGTGERGVETPRGGTETVLLVEDEAMILKLATTILASLGYTVLAAGTPGEALAIAARHEGPIHLMVTDVVMPEMSGKELGAKIAALRPGTKLLYTSGYTANTIAHRGVLDEGVQFLQKPFSNSDFAVKVREVLDREPGHTA